MKYSTDLEEQYNELVGLAQSKGYTVRRTTNMDGYHTYNVVIVRRNTTRIYPTIEKALESLKGE